MRPLSIAQLGVIAATSALGAGLLNSVSVATGHSPALVTPYLGLLFLALAVLLWVLGRGVRRMRSHRRTWMTPLLAMRTAVLARAAALMGSLAVGVLSGILVTVVPRLRAPSMQASAWGSGLALTGALVLVIVAVVVERWCIIDSGGEGEDRDGASSSRGPTGTPA